MKILFFSMGSIMLVEIEKPIDIEDQSSISPKKDNVRPLRLFFVSAIAAEADKSSAQ